MILEKDIRWIHLELFYPVVDLEFLTDDGAVVVDVLFHLIIRFFVVRSDGIFDEFVVLTNRDFVEIRGFIRGNDRCCGSLDACRLFSDINQGGIFDFSEFEG